MPFILANLWRINMKVIRKIFKDYGISFVMILNFMLIFLLIINVIRLDEKRRFM